MENYNIYDEIGRGQHSYVYKARRKRSIEYMAVKSTAKDRMNKILNEVQFLRTFSSPYVLKFHNWYESSNHIWIIFEFCIGGDLLNLITQDKTLPESTIKSFGYDMLMGLQYLHSNGVIYCDLKPANVLIDEYGGLKLSDLGLARKIPTDESVLKVDKLAPGSPHYMAPELFEQHPVHSFASDFWALGCVLYELRTGSQPFSSVGGFMDLRSMIQTKAVAIPPPAHVDMSRDLCDLLHRLLVKDPAQRISWDDILGHPFWDKTSHKTSSSPLPAFPPQPLFMKRYPTRLPQSSPICDQDQSPQVSQDSNSTCSNDDGGDSMIRTRPATAPPLARQPDLPPPNNDGTSARHPDKQQQLSPLPPPKTAPPPHRNLARPHQPVKLSTPKPAPHRIFTTLDGVVQPIVACADIEAVAVPRINETLVPFAVVPVASLVTQADIEAKLEQLYHYLRRDDVTVSDKHNALAYLFSISTSSKVANIIVNSSLMTLLGKLLEKSTSSALSSRLGLVLGYVVRYATFIAPDVVASLAPILIQAMDVENVQITRRVVACMGELAFYSVTQHQPLSCALVQSLVRVLQADDVIVRHYAVQTVGNILTHSSDDSDVGVVDPFVTPAVALALIEKSLRNASPPNLQMAAMLTLSQVLKHTLSQVLNHHNLGGNDAVFGLVARNLSIVWDHLWLARGSHHFYRWAIASLNVLNVTLQHAAQDTQAFLASICIPDSFDQLSQVLRRREHEEDSSIGGADSPAGGRFKEGEAKLTNLVQGKLLLLVYFGLQLSRDFAVCFVNSDLLHAVDSILSARHPHASAATTSYALQSAHQVVTLSVRIALEVTASLSKRADVLPLFDALLGKLLHYPACRQGLVDTLLDNANHEYEGFVDGLANVVQTPHATSSAIKALLAVLSNQDIVCDVVALNQVWFQSALVQVAQVVLPDTSSPDVLVDGIRVISSALDMFAPAPYVDEFVVHHLLPTFHGLLHSSTNDSARRFAVELLYSIVLRDVAFASILHRLDLIGPVLNLVSHTMSPSTTKLVVLVVTSHEVPVAALLALGLPSILSQAVLTVDNHALVGPTGDLLEAMYALLYDQYIAMTKEEAASSSPDPTLALYAQHLPVFVQCLPRLVDLCTHSSHDQDAQTCVDSASRCISILCQVCT
ncbi:ULK/ULK protein kinase, variant 1 [Aphanomyces astaci]|uniref:ULK/ULK protein kinase, variant 1 n=1 Tax=Aphanomyces astaci TaxID=112090 RepID=W4H701_APHAT|nr:ULK/ULK protein kinase, variant 1 [Aphanomyces astaci]ETV87815.1 ULK/ULK protein kinase, variant 1 [Aphanomyces astaci]|eukprot:XP_009822678.1 ULK/ULK protein kinase, variant 1 [Aphanomyces astaci]